MPRSHVTDILFTRCPSRLPDPRTHRAGQPRQRSKVNIRSRASIVCGIMILLAACGGREDAPAPALQSQAKVSNSIALQASAYHPMVQQLYVGYFGRPADAGGLAYFSRMYAQAGAPTNVAGLASSYSSSASIRSLVDAFGASAESNALYPGDNRTFVTAVYRNMFGRAPDAAGLAYWSEAMDRNAISRANGVLSILAGAQGSDAVIIANKQEVASAFTEASAAPDIAGTYAGMEVNDVVRSMLGTVTSATNVASFQQTISITLGSLASIPRKGTVFPAIEGIYFQTATSAGYLDRTGEFTYLPGEQVSLSIGGVELASVPATSVTQLFDPDDDTSSVNLARVLTGLDKGDSVPAVRPLPNTTLTQAQLDSEAGAVSTLASIDARAVLPQTGAPGVASLIDRAQQQAAAAAGTAGGTYSYFDSSLGLGANSFLGNGIGQLCQTDIVRVTAASVTLSASNWRGGIVTGFAQLKFSDFSTAEFNINSKTGSFSRGGKQFNFVINGPATSLGRILNMIITNPAMDGGTHRCNIENLHMRDNNAINRPPIARFMTEQSTIATPTMGASYVFTSSFLNSVTKEIAPPGHSTDFDGRVVSLTWHSSKDNRTITQKPARYGDNLTSFREMVGRGERVTISLTAVDDQGAKTTRQYIINPRALSLDDIVSLLDGKIYVVKEGSDSYYYRVDAALGRITEWEDLQSSGATACKAGSFTIGDATVGIDIAKVVFAGSNFSYTEDGYTTQFEQVPSLPSRCTATAIQPPPPPPPPAPPKLEPPQPSACEFINSLKECIFDPNLMYLGLTSNPDQNNNTDVCISWQVLGFPVKLATCSYATGGSGYTIVRNDGPTADVCWTVHYIRDRKPERTCHSSMQGGSVSRASCWSCNPLNAGAKSITLERYRVK